MFQHKTIYLATLYALLLPGATLAEIEVSGYIKNETSAFTSSGQVTGEEESTLDNSGHDSADILKFENSARIFANGDIGDSSSWHLDLNLIYDAEGVNTNYRGHRRYSQHDWLRELYIDTEVGGWDVRLGKQQVVWGTADGIKLLDIVNPTDWREFVQNTTEDARIPIWMLNAETNVGDDGNFQFIVSQVEESKIPGLSGDGSSSRSTTGLGPAPTGYIFVGNGQLDTPDGGHPFMMKGVDTIFGQVNGFFNIGAAMGGVTSTFANGGFTNPLGGANPGMPEFGTVGGFTTLGPSNCMGGAGPFTGAECLEIFTEMTNANITNLIDVSLATPGTSAGWNITNPNSTWEYMPRATFATFNAFVGMTTKHDRDYPDDFDTNFGMRFRNTLDSGLNFGVNYFYAYDPNPVVNIHWEDPATGQELVVDEHTTVTGGTVIQLRNPVTGLFYGADATFTPGNYTGTIPTDIAGGPGAGNNAGAAQLVFEETLERVHNLGASFDYAFDSDIPVVLRGEFLYQKDVHTPVIDLDALSRGNLTEALKTEEADFFKYVIGMDVTVFTNLLVSGQFIQFRNLDFVDKSKTCATDDGSLGPGGIGLGPAINCSRYTADPATMHLSNGMQKGWKNKEFYSLFFSKPFGPSQEHRWNNITMYEEGGGKWNRFDLEYSFSDELIGTVEWNHYWGNEDTMFGQFHESSNVQVGLKYLFD